MLQRATAGQDSHEPQAPACCAISSAVSCIAARSDRGAGGAWRGRGGATTHPSRLGSFQVFASFTGYGPTPIYLPNHHFEMLSSSHG